MNNIQRDHTTLFGREIDRNPVTVPYKFLYYRDHFQELTGLQHCGSRDGSTRRERAENDAS